MNTASRVRHGSRFFGALALFVLAGLTANAGTTYIRAGSVFDGESLRGRTTIVVSDSIITALENSAYVVPAGTDVIDASGCTVLPGFIDAHIHFMEPPLPFLAQRERYGSGRLAAEAASAFPKARYNLLKNGVTAVIDMGASPATYLGLRKALQKGSIIGPELYFPGPQITAPGGRPVAVTCAGQHDLICYGTFEAKETAAVRREVAALAGQGMDFIEVMYDRGGLGHDPKPSAGFGHVPATVAAAAINEAHRRGLRAIAQVGSEAEALTMVRAGVDGIDGRAAVLSSHDLLQEMSDRGVIFTPLVSPGQEPPRALRHAWESGVRLALGTGFSASGGANAGDDIFPVMRAWEALGASRIEVLRAVTATAAAKVGKDKEIGRIAPGYRANLVFFSGSLDSGALSAGRIGRVMLHGETVIDSGRLNSRYASGFRENSLSYLAYPYWDALLSFLAGGTVSDNDLFRTGINLSGDVLYSIRNMWAVNVSAVWPSPVPRTAIRTAIRFDNMNKLFYGTGNDTRQGDSIEYASTGFREGIDGTTRLADGWKLKTQIAFEQVSQRPYITETLPQVSGRTGSHQTMLSLGIVRDARDHEDNPWHGYYLSATGLASPVALGSSYGFERLTLDARGYVSPFRRHILAGRALYQQVFGAVPFYYLPEQGGDTLGRGYLPYRFRDRVALIGQFEYRFPVWSFISGAAFVDVGQFRDSPDDLTLKGFHPSIGFGPRFSFGPNESSIVGIDVGFTPEGWNLCLHNGQVF